MNIRMRMLLAVLFATSGILGSLLEAAGADEGRQVLRADAGWKFSLGDPAGAESSDFVDSSWRSADLPHD